MILKSIKISSSAKLFHNLAFVNNQNCMSSKLLNIGGYALVVCLMSTLLYICYTLMPESEAASTSPRTSELQTSDIQKWIEQNKQDKKEWEKQHQNLVQNLQQSDSIWTPEIGMSLSEIEKMCGQPHHSSYMKISSGTANVYTYRNGKCKGVLGFNTENKLVIINSN